MEGMNALIQCTLHIDPETLDEDDWYRAWAKVKFYLEHVHCTKFS